jgi:peptidase M10/serralysin-like protein/cadherin-like protein/Big-like domain-containing protein/hemolysin type calcium-binding protein
MVASVLKRGNVAIVSYATDPIGPDGDDIIRFVVLVPIGAGTQIFFSDRNWNGTAFPAAGGGDGTFTYTAGADIPAGTVITITSAQLLAAGMDLSNGGDTIYVYQGTSADSPTTFLYAIDIADANTTFNGNLTGTGLTVGVDAVAVAHDQASFAGQSTQIPQTQLTAISNNVQWHGHSGDDIGGTIYDDRADVTLSGPLNNPDMQLFGMMSGGGQSDAFIRMDNDEAANTATNLTRLFRDNPSFTHLTDLAFDIEDGFWFAVDNDGSSTTRLLKGNIADLVSGTSSPTITVLYDFPNDDDNIPVDDDSFIDGIEIDTANNKIYFIQGDIINGHSLKSISYTGTGLTDYGKITLATEPTVGFFGGVFDFTLDVAHNTAYFTYVLVNSNPPPSAAINYIVKVNSLSNPAGGYSIVQINGSDDPDGAGGNPANHFPQSEGSLAGIDIDIANQRLYFVTQRLGADGTAGVFMLDLVTHNYVELWQQQSNNATNTLQPFPTTQMEYIEVDTIGGRYYVSTLNNTDTAVGHDGTATDEGGSRIFSGVLATTAGQPAPTPFASVFENTANGAVLGMEIDYAPTLTLGSAGSTYTESTNLPASPAGPTVDVAISPVVNDADQAIIQGATVAISTGFVTGDQLTFTNSGGITGSYNATTGVVTFTGNASFAAYQTVLDSVRFTNAGDNPTDYGASTSRIISFTVTDGLLNSDPATATVLVVGINDAPVNTVGAAAAVNEDSSANTIAGVSVFDVDANPSTQDIVVTLSVAHGTISVLTNVAGGIVAGDITGGANGSGTITITATQNQINATLAAAGGLTYTPTGNYNGADALTVVTNDQGFNGNDPGLTGTGSSEQDSDNKTINITAVNDAPTVTNGTSENSTTILEDTPLAAGQSVTSLFNGHFDDATDQQQTGPNPTGSVANTLAGIAVTANGSSGATGQWQYSTNGGGSWQDIGAVTDATARLYSAGTLIRFNPTLNYNGPEPTLTVHLVDSSGGAVTDHGLVNLSGGGATGGITRYSAGIVDLGGSITAVNDAPVDVVPIAAQNIGEDGSRTFSSGNGNAISVSDVDVGAGNLTVTLSVLHGTLTLSGIAGLDFTGGTGDGTADATMTFSGTPAAINTALNGLVYNPAADYNGADTLTLTTNDNGNTGQDPGLTGTGTSEQDSDTVTINIAAVADIANDAVNLAEDAGATNLDGIGNISLLANDSFEDPNRAITAVTQGAHGTVTINNNGTAGTATDDFVVYTPTADYHGGDSFTYTVTSGGVMETATATVTVTPVVDIAADSITVLEDSGANHLNGIANTSLLANDSFENPGRAITSAGPASHGSVTINNNGTMGDTSDDYVVYTPTGNYNGPDSFNYTVTSGGATESVAVTVGVTSVNDAPVLANLDADSVSFTEGGSPVKLDLVGTAAALSDDQLDFNGGKLTVHIGTGAAPLEDVLFANDPGNVTLSGGNVDVGGSIIGTYTGGGVGQDLVVDFTALATVARVQTLVRALNYSNTNTADPSTDTRAVSITLIDGGGIANSGADTVVVTTLVNIVPVNDPPEGGASNNASVAEDLIHTFTVADFAFGMTDPENDSFASVVIVTLPGVGGGTIKFDNDAGGPNPAVAISAGDEFTAGQLAAGQLTYTPAPAAGTSSNPFTFKVRDDGGILNGGVDLDPTANTFTMNTTTGNNAPAVDLNGVADAGIDFASSYTEDGAAAAIADTDVSVSDPDPLDMIESATITVTDAIAGDQLTLAGALPPTISVQSGLGTSTLVLSGSASGADYQTALTMVRYSSTSNNPTVAGTDLTRSVTVTVSDGTANSPVATTLVTLTATNDPPNGTDAPITATEDAYRLLAAVDFGFTDPDGTGAMSAVTITSVTGGKIYYDADGSGGPGDPVEVPSGSLPQTYTVADLADGKVSYKANLNLNGNGVGTIGFKVADDSGQPNDTDPVANTLTVNVDPVNDKPDIPNSPTINATEQVPIKINASITVSDVDLDARNGGNGDYSGAAFAINRTVSNAEDLFSFATGGALFTVNGSNLESGGNVIATLAQSGGILNINFVNNGTVPTTALVNDVLQHLQYTNSSDSPPASVTLIYIIQDGAPGGGQGPVVAGNNIDGGQVTINIADTAEPPVVDLNGAGAGTGNAIGYTEGQAPVSLAPAGTVADSDSPDLDTGVLTVEFTANGEAADELLIVDTDFSPPMGFGPGDISVNDPVIYYYRASYPMDEGPFIEIGTFTGGTNGDPLVITLNANATPEIVQSLVRAIRYHSSTDAPSAAQRTVTFTLTDGDGNTSNPAIVTINVTPVNSQPVAQDDSFITPEDTAIVNGDLFANNGSGPDEDPDGPPPPLPLQVTHINGAAVSNGQEIILPSGAKLTIRSDGTFDYDPNDKFNTLTSESSGETGAVNIAASDSFTYRITGGDEGKASIVINGVHSPEDLLEGDGFANVITGTVGTDQFRLQQGGNDSAFGGDGHDVIYYGAAFNEFDSNDGGAGTDVLILQGNYNLTLDADSLVNIEFLSLQSGSKTVFGDTAGNSYDYSLTTVNENVGVGELLTVNAQSLLPGEDFTFNGSAEIDGKYLIFGGNGIDTLTGGAGNDVFFFEGTRFGSTDTVNGGGGRDALLLSRGNGVNHIEFQEGSLTSIESISVNNRYASDPSATPSYELVLKNGNVALDATLIVNGSSLGATQTFNVDGSLVANGLLNLFGGAGDDIFVAGAKADTIYAAGGADTSTGGAGADTFQYRSESDSAVADPDQILDFQVGVDKIDLHFMDADSVTAGDQAFTFIGSGAFTNTAGQLRATFDSDNNVWSVQGDTNGDGAADFLILVTTTTADPLVGTDFLL